MKYVAMLAVLALACTGCDDRPDSTTNWPAAKTAPTKTADRNIQRPVPPSPPPGSVPLPITRTFHGHVLAKHARGFVFQGLSKKQYLLIPTSHLTDKPPHEAHLINYDQVKIGQKLTVRLSLKLPFVPVYLCEGVTLHGVRLPDGRDLTPTGDLIDD
jgi:hypothetical protein